MMDMLAKIALPLAIAGLERAVYQPVMKVTQDAEGAQAQLLMRILQANRDTEFGRAHDFSTITGPADFQARVPVQNWDMLAPLIERQIATGDKTVVADPLVALARTSGSTGRAKDIPVTEAALKTVQKAQRLMAVSLYRHTGFFRGKILAMYSPDAEGSHESGLPFGASSGQAYRQTPALFRAKFAYPPALAGVTDAELKYYLYLVFGLLEDRVSGIATANPSTLLRLATILNDMRPRLIGDLSTGKIDGLGDAVLNQCFTRRSRRNGRHLRRMIRLLQSDRPLILSDIWPTLQAVTCWTGGSCGIALEKLRGLVPACTRFVEIGYRASEFIGTVNIDARDNSCIPLLTDTYFEFIAQHDWEQGDRTVTPFQALQPGCRYYALVTTSSGLYRYDINDIVQVDGFCGTCPIIRFLQKGKGVTSITGEKLYLHQAMTAVKTTMAETGGVPAWFLMQADAENARYCLYLEPGFVDMPLATTEALGQLLDRHLMHGNIEYADKRASARLGPPVVHLVRPGTGEAAKQHAVAAGQRESQYKPVCLQYRGDDDFDIDGWQM